MKRRDLEANEYVRLPMDDPEALKVINSKIIYEQRAVPQMKPHTPRRTCMPHAG